MAEALRDTRAPEVLVALGMAAKAKNDQPEMQRMFDRAVVRASEGKVPFVVAEPGPRSQRGIAWTGDGSTLAVITDQYVSLLDARAGYAETRRLADFGDRLSAIAFSPDGKTLAVAAQDNVIRLFETAQYRETRRLSHDPEKTSLSPFDAIDLLSAISFSPDGSLLASATSDGGVIGNVRLWHVGSGKAARKPEGVGSSRALSFDATGKTLIATAAVSGQREVRRWAVATGKLLKSPVVDLDRSDAEDVVQRFRAGGAPTALRAFAFSADRARVAVALDDGAYVLDVAKARDLGLDPSLAAAPGEVAFSFSADGRLAIDSADGVAVADAGGRPLRKPAAGAAEAPRRVLVAADGAFLATVGDGVVLWSLAGSPDVRRVGTRAGSVSFSQDGKRLATTTWNALEIWELRGLRRSATMPFPSPMATAFSPDGKSLAVSGMENTWFIDLATMRKTQEVPFGAAPTFERVGYSPDGALFAVGGALLDAKTGAKRAALEARPFEFSPDGKLLATARGSNLLLIDPGGQASFELRTTWDEPTALAFSSSGKWLLSASGSLGTSEVQLWDVVAQKELRKLGEGIGAAFLPNEEVLVVAGRAIALHARDGRRLASLTAISGKDAGYASSGGATPFYEILGSDLAAARAALGCRLGDALYPFEVCGESYEASGIVSRASTGAVYEDEP